MVVVEVAPKQTVGSARVKRGDELIVRLIESATTGFRWANALKPDGILEPISSTFEVNPETGIGGGGHRILRFRAIVPGQASLRLILRQDWLPDAPQEQVVLQIFVE